MGIEQHDLVVFEMLDRPRLRKEGGDHRGDEHLAPADADDERTVPPSGHELAGMVTMHDDECEMALELRERGADGFAEVTGVMRLDEMGDRLGVGFRAKRPFAESAARSSTKFSTIPLRTIAISPSSQDVRGCAFSRETRP